MTRKIDGGTQVAEAQGPMDQEPGHTQWTVNKAVARGLLHNRQARRRLMANCAFVLLGVFAAGQWLIDGWLTKHPWMFVCYWAGCMVLTLFVILFALYDMARVVREERDKLE